MPVAKEKVLILPSPCCQTKSLRLERDLAATKDRMNFWTYFGYDGMHHKIAETNANSVVTRYGYCDCGALMSITNAWSAVVRQVISFNYDYQGNRTYIYLPDFTIIHYFNAMRQLASWSPDSRQVAFVSYELINAGAQ